MKIYLATDHAGFELKEYLKKHLVMLEYDVEDCGAFVNDPQDDYPDFIEIAALKVAQTPTAKGIVIGGSGQGEAMAANKVKGIRAAVYYGGNEELVKLSREHNDANILSLGARFLSQEEALDVVKLWIKTPFSQDERHKRRIEKLDKYS